jgi:CheY-like chemotaxis protein
VGTLIGGVAHELNNPLHAIRNFAELLLMEPRSTEDREALEIIQREADRAAKVVSDLRMIARQTQESGTEHEPTDLNDIIRHVLKVRRYALDTGNVEVREDLAADLPRVMANRGEIEQVVLNVVVNAEQAMRAERGERRLIVRTRPTSEGAAVHVVDNGPGMSPHQLERIFDPFYTTKDPGEGTGLGLALVHTIIAEHGGNIHVESEIGKGTAFRIDLPRAPARAATAADESGPAAAVRPLHVLVVDDEEAVRRVSARFLERVGHRVDTAADGAEALQMLNHTSYDAVVADLRMPGLDGEELFHRLRARGDGLERRLVFLTGDAASEQAARVVAAARVPVLVKPVRLAELARTIALTVRGNTPEREESP